MTTMPVWAASMVRNYRAEFKQQHGRETILTDDETFQAIEAVGVAPDPEQQLEWGLSEMFEREQRRAT